MNEAGQIILPGSDHAVCQSQSLTCRLKRKLIAHIISEQNLLEGSNKNEFEKLMKDVMSVRNAFAHGRLSSDDKRVWLSFFEGTPRKEELTDDYLTKVETLLGKAFDKAFELAVKIGATKPTEPTDKTI